MFRDYWWPQLWKFVNEFVDSCDVCAHAKNPCHCLHGLFQPLPVHTSPWSSISMDFTMDFSQSNSFDSIMVVVDHFMKTTHFIPYNKSITNRKTTKLFLDHVYHGFFEDIIFYHGPQFTFKFWKRLFKLLPLFTSCFMLYCQSPTMLLPFQGKHMSHLHQLQLMVCKITKLRNSQIGDITLLITILSSLARL